MGVLAREGVGGRVRGMTRRGPGVRVSEEDGRTVLALYRECPLTVDVMPYTAEFDRLLGARRWRRMPTASGATSPLAIVRSGIG